MNEDLQLAAGADPLTVAAAIFLHILPNDFARYLIGAGGVFLLVNVLFAKALAGRKIRKRSPEAQQMRREFLTSMRTTVIFALAGVISVMGGQVGITKAYMNPAQYGWLYFGFSLFALIVLHDAWFYWTHRLIHHPKLFRRVHRTHHKSYNPSPWTAYSFDISEAAVNAAFLPLILIVMPASYIAIFLFLLHMIVRNAVGHCGYELFPSRRSGRPMFDWMTTVTHHDLHHAQAGWNYGLSFTWWDRLVGTEHPLYHEKFAAAVGKPLDGSAIAAMKAPAASLLVAALSATLIIIAGAGQVRAQAELYSRPAPEGVWVTEGHGAHVIFESCAHNPDHLCGRMIWSWDPALMDAAAPMMLGGFQWAGEAWEDGWLINPEDGKTYRGKITPNADDRLTLKGCTFVFCRSQIWLRIDSIPGCAAMKTASPDLKERRLPA